MDWSTANIEQSLGWWSARLGRRGWLESAGGVMESPLGSDELERIISAADVDYPPKVLDFLHRLSGRLEFAWHIPNGVGLPPPFEDVFSGFIRLTPDSIADAERARLDWVRQCFSNEADPYDRVWHHKFGLVKVPNGDCIALSLAGPEEGAVVYLSHDDGDGHGKLMAPSMEALATEWAKVGFVGAEDWQWLPFLQPFGIHGNGPPAQTFRDLMAP